MPSVTGRLPWGPHAGRNALGRDPHRGLYLLIAACVCADVSIVPLLPDLRSDDALSGTEAGLLLSAGTAAMVIAPVPLGRLADRVGAARVVVAAGALATAASFTLAAASGFPALLVGRAMIGLTNAAIWTAGLALVTDTPVAVARAMGAGGAGLLCGPLLAGVLAHAGGPRATFIGATVLAASATAAFAHSGQELPASRPPQRRGTLQGVLRQPRVRAAAVGVLLLGVSQGAANLLAPAQLHAHGLSASAIGVLNTLAAAVALATAVLARRLVARHDAGTLAGAALLALALAWTIPAMHSTVPLLAAFLIAAAAARTLLNPASYLLARQGADDAGASNALTFGATNVMLGAAGLAGPLLASQTLGAPRLGFAAVALAALAAALTTIRASTRPGRTAPH